MVFSFKNRLRWNSKKYGKFLMSALAVVVLTIVLLVILAPFLEKRRQVEMLPAVIRCPDECRLSLVENIPEGDVYSSNIPYLPMKDVWLALLQQAEESIEIASYYWNFKFGPFLVNYTTEELQHGEEIYNTLLNVGLKNNVSVKIIQNEPNDRFPNIDTKYLSELNAAEVRSVNFTKLLGGGLLHTKFWIIDKKHFYIGSANMGVAALTRLKELGIVAYNCSCLASDLGKVFDIYWQLAGAGPGKLAIPQHWPLSLGTHINMQHPINITEGDDSYGAYIASAPPALNALGRTYEDDAIVSIVDEADDFVYISVTAYEPVLGYTPVLRFVPSINTAIWSAALERRVRVKVLVSWWRYSQPSEESFLRSLAALAAAYPGLHVQMKRFIPPDQETNPLRNVNHNKYIVTNRAAYVGSSKWFGESKSTAGVAFVFQAGDVTGNNTPDVRRDLQDVFERDWVSPYAVPLL